MHLFGTRAQEQPPNRLESARRVEQLDEDLGLARERRAEPNLVGRSMARAPQRPVAAAAGNFERALDKFHAEPGGKFRQRRRQQQRPSVALHARLAGNRHGRS